MANLRSILALGPVMPVIVINDAEDGVPLAEALLEGGINVIEITLRTAAALGAMEKIAVSCPDMVIGAGTVLDGSQAVRAKEAGAVFAVSPGATMALIEGCAEAGLDLLPGASSASEAMALYEKGFDAQKFFPAVPAGGVPFLKSLASPLPQITFCPTGGITQQTASSFLALDNVACVGGSWLATSTDIADKNFSAITARAKDAAKL
ncbi:MAG: bifunctional 4-hydroxy-2-oxoglutarate aldolase/2-dehydro-3-deoxy-phosphogluconate aldolase [Candidatus Puniceispirillaceae bacterium]